MKIKYALGVLCGILWAAGPAQAVNINGYEFDLGQFTGASVQTSFLDANHIHGNTWDNLVGVDMYTLGELATAQYGFDPGDHISLGDYSAQDSFTLTYGTGFSVGNGQGALFVLYESSGRTPGQADSGRTGWDISFNGGAWLDAATYAYDVSLFSDYAPSHGQIVFDLTALGFSVGDVINTVSVQNHIGVGPDFTFAGHVSSPVPEPASILILGMGLAGIAVRRRVGLNK